MTVALAQSTSTWIAPVRAVWIITFALVVALNLAGLPREYARGGPICEGDPCPPSEGLLTSENLEVLVSRGISPQVLVLILITLKMVPVLASWLAAALIFWQRPSDRIAVFASFTLLLFFNSTAGASQVFLDPPLPVITPILLVLNMAGAIAFLFFYVFPDGRFQPGWLRWIAALWVLFQVVGLVHPSRDPFAALYPFSVLIFVVAFAGVIVSQAIHYREILDPALKQQIKWVSFGILCSFGLFLSVWGVGYEILWPRGWAGTLELNLIGNPLLILAVALIPLSFTFAMLRYRLWDIDLVIRRTLQYTILTALLALAYFGGLVSLQQLLGPLTGSSDSPVATVLTTLGIVALFAPLRRRVVTFLDRRFYRTRYNAERTLEQFSGAVRDEVALEALIGNLMTVVGETMHPRHVSLWLADRSTRRPP